MKKVMTPMILFLGASPSPNIVYESNKIDIIISININEAIGHDVDVNILA